MNGLYNTDMISHIKKPTRLKIRDVTIYFAGVVLQLKTAETDMASYG